MGLEVFLVENKLVVTVVLYQTEFSQTPSYALLKKYLSSRKEIFLFIYDNSEKAQTDELFNQMNVTYVHDKTNPGLAKAYNAAIQYLKDVKGELLLLLDQDTLLEEAYFQALFQLEIAKGIGAYVPLIKSHDRQISPVFSKKYINRQSEYPVAGTYLDSVMAINSGTVLPKQTITDIGSFNTDFPLDFLDHWLFWELHRQHKKIEVLNFELNHDLSVLDYRKVSDKRYDSIIHAETLFYTKYDQSKLNSHKKQLLLRTIKQFFCVRNRKIWQRTFSEYVSLMRGK